MRFAYIDSQGKEVSIPSVDALRLRIALKAIVEDTVFYDSTSARWAPAEEHEIFRTLKKELGEQEEGHFVAPPPETEGDADLETGELEVEELDPTLTAGDDDDDDDWRFDISNAPADRPSSDGAEASTPLGTSSWLDVDDDDQDRPDADFDLDSVAFRDEPAESESGGALDLVPELGGPEPPTSESPPEDTPVDAADDDGDAPFDLSEGLEVEGADTDALPDFVEPTHVADAGLDGPAPDAAPLEGLSQDRFDADASLEEAGWGDEPPPPASPSDDDVLEVEGLPDLEPETPAARPQPRAGGGDLPVPSREELAARRRADATGSAGSRPKPGPPPRRRSRSGSGGVLVAVLALVVVAGGAGWFVLGRGAAEAEVEPDPLPEVNVEIPDLPVALEPAMRSIADETRRSSLDALRSHHTTRGVPAEPDQAWLAGVYLANASDYPGVESYWTEMGSYLRAMQAAEDSLFMAELARRMQASELTGEDRERVEARVAAGFRATARDRGVVFQRARAVSEAALRLHTFLVDNEDRIAYEPGVGGLSADPVLEAIPDTPELGETMWARVGDITQAMDALDFLDRVTTERLVDAIVQRLSEIEVR